MYLYVTQSTFLLNLSNSNQNCGSGYNRQVVLYAVFLFVSYWFQIRFFLSVSFESGLSCRSVPDPVFLVRRFRILSVMPVGSGFGYLTGHIRIQLSCRSLERVRYRSIFSFMSFMDPFFCRSVPDWSFLACHFRIPFILPDISGSVLSCRSVLDSGFLAGWFRTQYFLPVGSGFYCRSVPNPGFFSLGSAKFATDDKWVVVGPISFSTYRRV